MGLLEELASKAETIAKADTEALFLAAAKAAFPEPPSDYQPRREPMFSPAWDVWAKRNARISNLTQWGAYLDAAMLFVPEGYYPTMDFVAGRCWIRDAKGFDVPMTGAYGCGDEMPAALLAASLRARHVLALSKGDDV